MPVAQLTCKNCSAAIEQGDRFCWDCGEKLITRGVRAKQLRDESNPLLKAEIVFIAALLTFIVSAVAWNFSNTKKPKAHTTKTASKAISKPQPMTIPVPVESELDRLWATASTIKPAPSVRRSASTPVAAVPVPATVARKPATITTTSITATTPTPASSPPNVARKNPHIADVAEYNKKLEAYFATHPTATTRGAEDISMGPDSTAQPSNTTADSAAAEPPSYQEWLKAGKPDF